MATPTRSAVKQAGHAKDKPEALWNQSPRISLDEGMKIYSTFRGYIQHEDGLINNRLVWMLTIHGFLYAAYALALTKEQDTITTLAISSVSSAAQKTLDPVFVQAISNEFNSLFWFRLTISLVGLGVSSLGFVSICSAIISIKRVVRLFRKQNKLFNFNVYLPGQRGFIDWMFGKYPSPLNFSQEEGSWLKVKTYGTKAGVYFPRLAGGGSKMSAMFGATAGAIIPVVLLSVWIYSIFYASHHRVDIAQLYYIYFNPTR